VSIRAQAKAVVRRRPRHIVGIQYTEHIDNIVFKWDLARILPSSSRGWQGQLGRDEARQGSDTMNHGFRLWFLAIVGIGASMSAQLWASPMELKGGEAGLSRTRGAALFNEHCASCHGAEQTGGQFGPALRGAVFVSRWSNRQDELLRFMVANMPPADPGSLSAADYGDVLTYISGPGGLVQGTGTAPAGEDEEAIATPSAPLDRRQLGPIPAAPEVFRDATYHREEDARRRLLDALTPITDTVLEFPPAEDWLMWRGSYQNISYSPLDQVNRDNAGRLSVAWAWSLPVAANEVAPLVHGGVLFVSSGDQMQALDAATGTLLWRYKRDLPEKFRGITLSMKRNFAIYGDNLYLATSDRHTIALEAKTGRLVWDHEVIASTAPIEVMLSAGPTAVRGKILQGTSNALRTGGNFIVGLDAKTGREIWRFESSADDDSWNGASVKERYGGSFWIAGSYDPDSNLVYYGVAGTYDTRTLLSPPSRNHASSNNALYTDSTVALNPDTGKLVWYHQHFPREVWDLDEVFERALVSLRINGQQRKLVINTGKLGILDALDSSSGAYVFSKDFGLQNLVTAVDPHTGARTLSAAALVPEPNKIQDVCPSPEGVRNWMTTAFNPTSGIMYFPMEETCMDFRWQPATTVTPAEQHMDIGWSVKPRPNSDGNYARLQAVDLATLKTLWVERSRAPLSSSLLATQGGLIFNGSRDRMFRASDDRTGKTLWRVRLNAVPNASPVTYMANGKQYVAIVAGGGGPHDSESVEITPEIDNSTATTTLWVFALP
jgi:alcohol dehydrogenase (cytochrome c)